MLEFKRFRPSDSQLANDTYGIVQPNQIPVFLFPGIFCNHYEMQDLAARLHEKYSGQRPIFIMRSSSTSKPTTTDSIIKALKSTLGFGPIPYLLVGYSDGCRKAIDVAHELEAQDQTAQVFLIDGVPLHTTKSHFGLADTRFDQLSIDAISDIVNILNYAASLCGLSGRINLQDSDKQKLTTLTADALINHLTIVLQNKNETASDADIDRLLERVAYLKATLTEEAPTNTSSLTKAVAFLTDATIAKHRKNCSGSVDAGWGQACAGVEVVTAPKIAQTSHRHLLVNTAVQALAELIDRTLLSNVMTLDELHKRTHQYLDRQYESASNSTSASSSTTTSDEERAISDSDDSDIDADHIDADRGDSGYKPISVAGMASTTKSGLFKPDATPLTEHRVNTNARLALRASTSN